MPINIAIIILMNYFIKLVLPIGIMVALKRPNGIIKIIKSWQSSVSMH